MFIELAINDLNLSSRNAYFSSLKNISFLYLWGENLRKDKTFPRHSSHSVTTDLHHFLL